MPKMKTKRAAAKRFKVTGSGRVKYQRAFRRHQLTHKSKKRKRTLRTDGIIHDGDMVRVKRMLPYG